MGFWDFFDCGNINIPKIFFKKSNINYIIYVYKINKNINIYKA
jgi:hypothetical protein